MSELYTKENFIEVAVENFHDFINNLTFSLQKYVDMFYNTLPELYEETMCDSGTFPHEHCKEMSSFLYSESENIISMKCKTFIFQSINLIQNKFDKLSENIMDDSNKDTVYAFSEEGYFFFLKEIESVDWGTLNDHRYYEKNKHSINEMCQFDDYMSKRLEVQKMNTFTDEKIKCNRRQLLVYLQTAYTKLIDTLHKMRKIADESTNLYDIVIMTRKVINMLVVTYVAVRYIEIIDEKENNK